MYIIECQCRFRNVWSEVQGAQSEYFDLGSAIRAARVIAQQRRTPVRIVDDSGNVVWQ